MPEFRRHPLSDCWVVIAENRRGRPLDFRPAPRRQEGRCPFCAGNEADTPPAIAAYGGTPDRPGSWQVRVVPNLYPAVDRQSPPNAQGEELFRSMSGYGAHEVIVESPHHLLSLTQLTDAQQALTLTVYRDRLRELKHDRRLAYAQIFKNVGAAAGASLEHLHSQLLALPVTPAAVAQELQASLAFFRQHGACLFCRLLDQELDGERRMVAETPLLAAYCPYASRFPYEIWIAPRHHASHFEQASEPQLQELAGLLRRIVQQLEAILPEPAYNYLIHTAPFDTAPLDHYHWHIEIIPRLENLAGFEWGTGCFINTVAPEQAAEALRRSLGSVQLEKNETIRTRKTS